jgi:outer membrane protein TolC
MAGFYPTVGLNLGANLQNSNLSQRFASGLEVDRPGVIGSGLNGGIVLNWLFFDGGKMFITRKKLNRQLSAAELRLQNQIMNFADSLSAAYYQVVIAGLDLKVLGQSRKITEDRLRIAQEQQQAGSRPASDALQAQMDLNQLSNKILFQQKQLEIRKGALNLMIGREPEFDFIVSDTVKIPSQASYADLKNKVLERNLALKAQKEGIEVSRLGLGELRSRMFPQISLNTALNYQRSSSSAGFALYNRNIGPVAGITMSLPLFNGLPIKQQLRLAGKELYSREIQLKISENRLLFQLWRSIKNLELYLESLDTETSNQSLAAENLRIVQERFKTGLTNSLEVREAENQVENSGLRLQQLRFQARIAANQVQRLAAELQTD